MRVHNGLRTLSLAIAATAVLGLFSACSKDPETLVADARTQIGKGQVDEAVLSLKTALQENPGRGEARFLLGKIYLDNGDAAGAEAEFRRALVAGYADEQLQPLLAQSLLEMGKAQQVLTEFQGRHLRLPDHELALRTAVAEAYGRTNAYDKAASTMDQVLSQQPANASAQLVNAKLQAVTQGAAQGLVLVRKIVAEQPSMWQAWVFLGDLLQQQDGLSAETIAAYTKAVDLHPRIAHAHGAIISSLLAAHQIDAARQRHQKMRAVLPTNPLTVFYEALIAQRDGKHERAREIFQALLKVAPDNVRFLLGAGESELQLNAPLRAVAHFGKASALVPDDKYPRRMQAQALLRAGQYEQALAALKPLLDRAAPESDDLVLAGQAYLLAGRPGETEKYFARGVAADPQNPRAQEIVALTKLAKGFDESAYKTLTELAARDKSPRLDLPLVNLLISLNRPVEAEKAIAALAVKQSSSAMPALLRGRVALTRKDIATARQQFEEALKREPAYFPALFALANIDLAQGKTAEAKQRFETLLDTSPQHTECLRALGDLSAGLGDAEAAGQYYERAAATSPADLGLQLVLFDHHLKQHELSKALAVAQAADTARPDDPLVLSRLARAFFLSEQYEQAVATYSKWQKLQPKSIDAQVGLAVAQFASGQNPLAVKTAMGAATQAGSSLAAVFDRATPPLLEIKRPDAIILLAKAAQAAQPKRSLGFILEGDIVAGGRKPDQALVLYQKAMALDQPGLAAMRAHRMLVSAGHSAEAGALAERWQKEHPADQRFVQYLADADMSRGSWAEAEAGYRKLLPAQSQNALVLNNLAYVVMQQGKPGSLELAERAAKLAPNQPLVLDTQASVLAAAGRWAEAREVQQRVVGLIPSNVAARLRLAGYLLKLSDKPGAKRELDRLAKMPLDPQQQKDADALRQQLG